jgi:hypothetical protein
MPCTECLHGALPNQTYGNADIPPGTTPVQACDTCSRTMSDQAAAATLARIWGTTYGYAEAPDPNEPGDWWVTNPAQTNTATVTHLTGPPPPTHTTWPDLTLPQKALAILIAASVGSVLILAWLWLVVSMWRSIL